MQEKKDTTEISIEDQDALRVVLQTVKGISAVSTSELYTTSSESSDDNF